MADIKAAIEKEVLTSQRTTSQNVETIIKRLDEIIHDEMYECNTKYEKLTHDFQMMGLPYAAGMVESIRTDQCRHGRLYEIIKDALESTL